MNKYNVKRIAIVLSTGGSVANELLKNQFFKDNIVCVISDRSCRGLDLAKTHGISTINLNLSDKTDFSNNLLELLLEKEIDYIISFYTKLFCGDILKIYKDRIINLHPAILPAFKGLDGFGDSIKYEPKLIGSTIHFIDENMDEGKIILQTATPVNENIQISDLRHKIFIHQCKSLLQVVKWITDERLIIKNKKVMIMNSSYNSIEFSPDLDFNEAIQLYNPFFVSNQMS